MPGASDSGVTGGIEQHVRFIDVQKSFDGRTLVVKNLNLDVAKGEFLTLLGPSGSGKTTTLLMLAGFEAATHGEITLSGRPINRVPPHKRGIGMVFQNYALFPHMTVNENLAFPLQVRRKGRAETEARVKRVLEMVELPQMGNRRPAQLSGGQQQRVAVARALVFDPELVLMDEPLGALDKQLREQMQSELKALQQQVGITFVFVTHDQGEALSMADRVAIFNQGRIVQVGTPEDVYERPQNRFVADFVGSSNLLPPDMAARLGGARAWTSLRPEKIRLLDTDNVADGLAVADAVLQSAHYQGAATRLTFDAAGTRLAATLPAGAAAPAIGSTARLAWPRSLSEISPDVT